MFRAGRSNPGRARRSRRRSCCRSPLRSGKACGGVRPVRPQAQQIQFQRNVPFLCGQTQPFHFPPVDRFGAGKLNQIRVRQIGIQPGIQSCNALVYINFQNLRIIRWLIDINTIDLVVDIVLTEQQIVDGILRDARKQIVKNLG